MTVTLSRLEDVHSPELANRRDVLVALPPSYAEGDARYPVVYMHDGQNLFDPATSYAGCLLYTSPSPRDISGSRMPSSA